MKLQKKFIRNNGDTFSQFVECLSHITYPCSDSYFDYTRKLIEGIDRGDLGIAREEDASELLNLIVEYWVTVRGFALTSMLLEEYKRATVTNVKKTKGFRKYLQNVEGH